MGNLHFLIPYITLHYVKLNQSHTFILDEGLYHACQGGQIDLIHFLIDHGASDWDDGLFGACRGGQREVVILMIEKGACEWNMALFQACGARRPDLIKLMIEKGASVCLHCHNPLEDHLRLDY